MVLKVINQYSYYLGILTVHTQGRGNDLVLGGPTSLDPPGSPAPGLTYHLIEYF